MRGGGLLPIVSESSDISPIWTPDGKRLIHGSAVANRDIVWDSTPADNSGPPTVLASGLAVGIVPDSVSPDGKIVIGASPATQIWQLSLAPGNKPEIFLDTPGRKRYVRLSPDGHWVAYTSDESGEEEVYVQAYPGPGGGRAIVSTEGGTNPRWSRNGKELFYLSGAKMMAVDVIQLTPVPRFGKPKMLFEGRYPNGYDVSPDGKRFLMVKVGAAPQASQPDQLKVVVNWLEELRRRLPIPK
jgi:hypothetical protein